MSADWKPTPRLRWTLRTTTVQDDPTRPAYTTRILQQWYAPDVPAYMRGSEGEWRDVPVEAEVAP